MVKQLPILLIITIIFMLGAFLVNRRSIPELIKDRIHYGAALIGLILMYIYIHTDIGRYIGSSYIGFHGGWFIKDLWIYLHTTKK